MKSKEFNDLVLELKFKQSMLKDCILEEFENKGNQEVLADLRKLAAKLRNEIFSLKMQLSGSKRI